MESPDAEPSSEVTRLKDEVAALNQLLEDSALTLQALNTKVRALR
jgi:hypothetical protein